MTVKHSNLNKSDSGIREITPSDWTDAHVIDVLDLTGQSSDPAIHANGNIWYNSTENVFKFFQDGAVASLIDAESGAILTQSRANGHAAWNPTFSRIRISGGDGLYRHESTVCQDAAGVLHVFFAGNASASTESAVGQRIFHSKSSDGGATWSTAVAVHTESATNTLVPTNVQGVARCEAVGAEVWLFFGNRGTSNEEALIWGRLSAAGVWTWARLLINSSNAPSWSTTDLTGTPAAGYSVYWTIEGDICSITPTDISVRTDGGVDILVTGTTAFAVIHHMFLVRLSSAGAFTLIGNSIPSGRDLVPAIWEGSLIRLPNDAYVVHARRLLVYAGQSGIALIGGERQVMAESPDGMGWTAAETTGLRVHSSRGSILPLSSSRWILAATAAWSNRNDLCLGMSSDPRAFVIGPLASNEDIATEYREYPELTTYTYGGETRIGMVYSGRLQSAAAPNEIHWASCAVPTETQFMAQITSQRANRDDAAAVSSVSGTVISIPPHGSMSWEPTPYQIERRTIRWRVDTVPGGVPYIIAAVGNVKRSARLYLTTQNSTYVLKVDGQVVGNPITDPTVWQTAVIELDKRNGVARIMGRDVFMPRGEVFITSGDAFDQSGFTTGTAGNLLIDTAYCTVAETPRLASVAIASTEGGPNLFLNPEFSIDQRFAGAAIGNSVGNKIDMTYLADNGGCGLSIQQGSFSIGSALAYTGGVQTHFVITRTSAGTSAPQMDFYLGDVQSLAAQPVIVEFDAYDAGGQSYPMEVWAYHDFGTGGAYTSGGGQSTAFRIGVILVDNFNGRRHAIECFWPTISSSATLGTDHFCALQLRPAFHALASNADLRIGRMDVHQGTLTRAFQRPSPATILANCKRYFQSIKTVDAFGNFGIACATSTTNARLPLVRGAMRKAPSITVSAAGDFGLVGATSQTVTAVTVARNTEIESEINLTVASGLTAWSNYQLRDVGSGAAAMYLSARYR